MKDTTPQWLSFAETDLRTCEKLLDDDFLTNIVAFHSQQVIAKYIFANTIRMLK